MIQKIKKIISTGTIKDSFISLTGNGIIAVGGAAFTIILAREFSPDKFGLFSALWSLGILFASLGDFGISAALTNFLPKLKNERSAIISLTFWLQLIIAFILAILVINLSFFKDTLIPGSKTIHFLIIGLLVFVYILEAFIENVFNAERRFLVTTSLQAIDSSVKLVILFCLTLFHLIDIETAFLATTASALIVTLTGLSKEFKNISFFFPKNQLQKIIKFAKWIAVSRIFGVAVSRIDVIILAALASSYQAGIFSAASRIALIFTLLATSIGNATAPRFSSFNSHPDLRSYLKKLFIFSIFLSVSMLFMAVISESLITVIFGQKYIEAVPVFQLLAIAMIPFMLTLVTVNPLIYYFNQPNFVAKVTIIQVSLLITLDILLIPQFGAIGPTISLGIANTLALIITALKIKSLLKKT
jgi:O-antigen/teichoic acid export membrane protein